MSTESEIRSFLLKQGENDPDEIDVWIETYLADSSEDESFEDYYQTSMEQIRMFSNVDWDGPDSDVSLQLSQAYMGFSNSY